MKGVRTESAHFARKDPSVTASVAGSGGGVAVGATQAVPVFVGQQQGAAIGSSSRDQHHVVAGDIEVALQVVVDVPVDRRQRVGPQQFRKMTDRQVVCLFVIQSSFVSILNSRFLVRRRGWSTFERFPLFEYRQVFALDQGL